MPGGSRKEGGKINPRGLLVVQNLIEKLRPLPKLRYNAKYQNEEENPNPEGMPATEPACTGEEAVIAEMPQTGEGELQHHGTGETEGLDDNDLAAMLEQANQHQVHQHREEQQIEGQQAHAINRVRRNRLRQQLMQNYTTSDDVTAGKFSWKQRAVQAAARALEADAAASALSCAQSDLTHNHGQSAKQEKEQATQSWADWVLSGFGCGAGRDQSGRNNGKGQ